jgi:DNA-binding transcriptional regulator/RsmH inhibitor MraZ
LPLEEEMKTLTIEEKLAVLEEKIDALLGESVDEKKVTDKKTMDAMGRITIPKTFRKILGIENSTADFLIMLKGKDIILRLKD